MARSTYKTALVTGLGRGGSSISLPAWKRAGGRISPSASKGAGWRIFAAALIFLALLAAAPSRADDNLIAASHIGRLTSLAIGLEVEGSDSATNDAQAFADTIQHESGRGLYSDVTSTAIAGPGANKDAVLGGLDKLIEGAKPNDTVLVLITGTLFEAGTDKSLYFNTAGVDEKGLEGADDATIQSAALSWVSVSDRLIDLSAKVRRVVVFIDTSYGGQTVTGSLSEEILKKGAPITVFASSAANQQAMEDQFDGVEHGVFTHYLLDAIGGSVKGAGGSPLVTLHQIASYVQAKVGDYSDQTQTPVLPFVYQSDYNQPLLTSQAAGVTTEVTPPTCKIITAKIVDPQSGFLHVIVQGGDDVDVSRFELYVDGVPVPEAKSKAIFLGDKAPEKALPGADIAARKYSRSYSADIPIPRGADALNLRAIAYDSAGLGGEDTLTVPLAGLGKAHGNLYVLAVGVRAYSNPDYDLDFADHDAADLTAFLQKQEGKLYEHVYATCLQNEQATPKAIRAALTSFDAAGPDDTVIVLLSGHGVQDNGKFYFCSYNVDVDNIEGTCVPGTEIVTDLRKVLARKLLFIDACRSGSRLGEQEATANTVADSTRQDAGILVISSCMGDQYSFEDKNSGHGVFTEALLETLEGKAGVQNGVIPVNEIPWALPNLMSSLGNYAQTPDVMLIDGMNLLSPLVDVQ